MQIFVSDQSEIINSNGCKDEGVCPEFAGKAAGGEQEDPDKGDGDPPAEPDRQGGEEVQESRC